MGRNNNLFQIDPFSATKKKRFKENMKRQLSPKKEEIACVASDIKTFTMFSNKEAMQPCWEKAAGW